MSREDREAYNANVRSFADALRASLAAKRGVTLEDLQSSGARGDDAEKRAGTGEGGSKCPDVPE